MTESLGSDCKPRKLGKRLQAALNHLNGGERLCKSLRLKETGETEIKYFYEPSGRRADQKTAEALIKAGLLRPLGDGLFGDDTSQTWIAA